MSQKNVQPTKNRANSGIMLSRQEIYSSPLPPPDILDKYEHIQSGLIEKIIEFTEAQGNHRRKMESDTLNHQLKMESENLNYQLQKRQIELDNLNYQLQVESENFNCRYKLDTEHLMSQVKHMEIRDQEAKRGQLFAFIIAIIAILGGIYVALEGHEIAGSIIGSGSILPMVLSHFIHGRKPEKNENTL